MHGRQNEQNAKWSWEISPVWFASVILTFILTWTTVLINLHFSNAECDTLLENLFLVNHGFSNFHNDDISMFILFNIIYCIIHITKQLLKSTWRLNWQSLLMYMFDRCMCTFLFESFLVIPFRRCKLQSSGFFFSIFWESSSSIERGRCSTLGFYSILHTYQKNKIISNAIYFPGHSLRIQSTTFLAVSTVYILSYRELKLG